MADKPGSNLPKIPPFHIVDGNGKRVEPANNLPPSPKPPVTKDGQPSERGMVSLAITLISSISLGIAMLAGAWFAFEILDGNKEGIFSKIVVVGLAYLVGWIMGAFGIRVLGNFILPYIIRVLAWAALAGVVGLQIVIITKLFKQEYHLENYVRYLVLFSAAMIALAGLHLLLEKHSLVLFAIPILLTSLAHLYLIVFHYVFVPKVNYEYIWGDIFFFIITTAVSILMMAHLGILRGLRGYIDRKFSPKDNPFVPER